jgi:3-oxoacyl-[acyl-carrier-protein] synthase-1
MQVARRVAITGYGIVSSLGNDRASVLAALRAGRSGVELIPERQELGFHSPLGGRIRDLEPPPVPPKMLRQMGPGPRIAAHAAFQAVEHSGIPEERLRSERAAMIIGNAGCWQDVYKQCRDFHDKKLTLGGGALARTMSDTVSANLSILLGTQGYSFSVSAACATGATSVGHAYQLIKWGLQDVAICGGVMEDTWEFACQFDALKVFSKRLDDPTAASRPFDRHRDGLVPSAGSSILVLEELESARARGATIHAELVGYSFSSDAHEMTTPSGDGGVRATHQALADAELTPADVTYVNAHATSTPMGDTVEAGVLNEVFDTRPFVSSTKSMTGHEGAAAGANEVVYTVMMMTEGFIAPSINIDELDPACGDLNVVANEALDERIEVAVSNAFGFGGVNTCLVLARGDS